MARAPLSIERIPTPEPEPKEQELPSLGPAEKELADAAALSTLGRKEAGLLVACREGTAEEVEGWLALGADPNACAIAGGGLASRSFYARRCALLIACRQPALRSASALLRAGAKPDGPSGSTPPLWDSWAWAKNTDVWSPALALLEAGASFWPRDARRAFETGDIASLRLMAARGFDFAAPHFHGFSLMDVAVDAVAHHPSSSSSQLRRSLAFVDEAISLGCDLTRPGQDGATLAMRAAWWGDRDALGRLDAAGVDFSAKSAVGATAGDYARAAGRDRLGAQLDERAMKPGIVEGRRPLCVDFELLESWGMDLDSWPLAPALPPGDDSLSAQLLRACESGTAKEVETLLAQGADSNSCDALGTSALSIACSGAGWFPGEVPNRPEAVAKAKALLGAFANPNPTLPDLPRGNKWAKKQILQRRVTLTHFVIGARCPELLDPLLAAGASLEEERSSKTPPSLAGPPLLAQAADLASLRLMLAAGVDPHHESRRVRQAANQRALNMIIHDPAGLNRMRFDVYRELASLAGGETPSTVSIEALATIALAGYEGHAMNVLGQWASSGVDFSMPPPGEPKRSFIGLAREIDWEAGAAWMEGALRSRAEREQLTAGSQPRGEAEEPREKPKRRL